MSLLLILRMTGPRKKEVDESMHNKRINLTPKIASPLWYFQRIVANCSFVIFAKYLSRFLRQVIRNVSNFSLPLAMFEYQLSAQSSGDDGCRAY